MGFLFSKRRRGARHVVTFAFGFGALCACEPVQTFNYEPRTAVQPEGPSVEYAVRFYDQDLVAIFQAGGRIIGDLEGRGNTASSLGAVDEDALAQAAARGGTHLIRTSKDIQNIFWQLSRARTDTDCSATPYSAHCSSVSSDPTFAKIAELPSARYTIVFVPCENWGQLPRGLRPQSDAGCDPSLAVRRADPTPKAALQQLAPMPGGPDADAASGETPRAPPLQPDDPSFFAETCREDRGTDEVSAFNRSEVTQAFRSAEQESLKCNWADHQVTLVVTFGQAGCVRQIQVEDEKHDAKFDACVVRAFSTATVPAFRGNAVTVSKHLGVQ